jgi:hypothetical protein
VLRHLQRMLEREAQRLDTRRAELGEVREGIRSLSYEIARTTVLPVADLEAVPADLAVGVIGGLMDEVGDGIVRTVSRTVEYGPGLDDERVRDLRERLDRGQVVQAVYPLDALDTPAGQRWVTSWAEAGERQRFVADPPSEFLVAGTSAVLACADWNVPQSDYVVIREPMIIAAFTALHEMAFASGISLGAAESDGPGENRLVDLMALGLKDEVIARTLGCSLRTVRRRIAALMDQHGVATRFQLGAALFARGRLEAGPLPLSPIRATGPARRKR